MRFYVTLIFRGVLSVKDQTIGFMTLLATLLFKVRSMYNTEQSNMYIVLVISPKADVRKLF